MKRFVDFQDAITVCLGCYSLSFFENQMLEITHTQNM